MKDSGRSKWAQYVSIGGAWILACVLGYSGAVKLADLNGFAQVLFRYDLLPSAVINVMAVFIACLEVVLAFSLVVNRGFRQAGVMIAGALFLVFGVLAGVTMYRGLNIACGCFSTDPNSSKVGWMTVGRNLGLTALAAWVFWAEGRARANAGTAGGEGEGANGEAPQAGVTS